MAASWSCKILRALQAELLAVVEKVFFTAEWGEEFGSGARLSEALLPAAALHLLPLIIPARVSAPMRSDRLRYQLVRLVRLMCRASASLHPLTMLASAVLLEREKPEAPPCAMCRTKLAT